MSEDSISTDHQLQQYQQLLTIWNRKLRFVSNNTSFTKLYVQSKIIANFIHKHTVASITTSHNNSNNTSMCVQQNIIDIGSGCGFPAVFWAIAANANVLTNHMVFLDNSDECTNIPNIYLIERNYSRHLFLQEVINRLTLRYVQAFHCDIKSFTESSITLIRNKESLAVTSLIITAQAVFDILQLLVSVQHLLYLQPSIVLLKNQYTYKQQLHEAQRQFSFIVSVEKCEYGVLVFISNIHVL